VDSVDGLSKLGTVEPAPSDHNAWTTLRVDHIAHKARTVKDGKESEEWCL